MDRRDFLQLAALTAASSLVGWRFAGAAPKRLAADEYDAVVVGAGLGGLSCAAHLARHGFRTLVLEQHYRLGGYATSFPRRSPDGNLPFTCEVSLHASALTSPQSKALLEELGVWPSLQLAPHKHAWSSRFPGLAFDVPAKAGLDGFERRLRTAFPDEATGIARHFDLWRGVMADLVRLDAATTQPADFQGQYPHLWAIHDKTIGQVVDAAVGDPRVKAILAQSAGYYGLPPSRLSAFIYLAPTGQYLEYGGYYLKGTSQALSDALVAAITQAGGEVRPRTTVTAVQLENGRAVGVRTADGHTYRARAVVVNASAPQLFSSLLPAGSLPPPAQARLKTFAPSPASCIVWLGLNQDITKRFPDPEVSFYPSLDLDANFAAAMAGDVEKASFSVMVYDNLVPGFSPPGCSTVCIVCTTGFEPWRPLADDYFAGIKTAYEKEKRRVTDLLIRRLEHSALPGLSSMIIMRDAATPLTNVRFTRNTWGSIYGYAPTVDNAFLNRFPNDTGIPGLILASAWGDPGGGYTGVLLGGKKAFKDVATALAHG